MKNLSPYMPGHVNYGNNCCGIFNVIKKGMVICNECGMTIVELIENFERKYDYFVPTPENINNLPEKIRDYIKELETVCDPAGIIQENACLLENVKALSIAYVEYCESKCQQGKQIGNQKEETTLWYLYDEKRGNFVYHHLDNGWDDIEKPKCHRDGQRWSKELAWKDKSETTPFKVSYSER